MNIWLMLPIVIPLLTAILLLLTWGKLALKRAISLVGAAALFLAGVGLLLSVMQDGIQAVQIGGWPAPFGITLVADLFSAIMVVVTGTMGLITVVYSLVYMDPAREGFGYHMLLHVLLMGVAGAFLTGDIFNLFVFFEIMLIASFVLLALGGERPQIEGAFKYVTLNLLASALFLTGVGILYSVAGTLNMADLAVQLPNAAQPGLVTALSVMFMASFGIKAGLFPLFFWLPDSYHTPPLPVTVIFSALLTKVGVYALIRVFTLLFVHETGYTHTLLLVIAGFTMVTGVLGAVAQMEVRRLLSFHIISQIGYLLMGLGLFTELALGATVFFMVHVIFIKSALFLVSGVLNRLGGTYNLKKLGGFYKSDLFLSLLFFIAAMSLAGIPPLSGFWAKLGLVRAGLEANQIAIVLVSLVVSVLTLYSMTKIWTQAFWKDAPGVPAEAYAGRNVRALSLGEQVVSLAPIIALVLFALVAGLLAEPFFDLALRAAGQLMDPAAYIQAVLG